eukprot:XP_003730114.1 PREDICTED: uncharacterized protein LOC100893702 [Strongylocentrotus purpuratus]
MEIMNLSSLRRTFFILLSVMGLFLVLFCFVSTEDYFVKQARIVKNAQDKTTHNLITAMKTTRQSLTLRQTTERSDDRDNSRRHHPSVRSTTDPAVTMNKYHSLTTARKSTAILQNGTRDQDVDIFGKGNLNKTEVGQDSLPLERRVIPHPHVMPIRIKSTNDKSSEIGTNTKDPAKNQNFTDNKTLTGIMAPHPPYSPGEAVEEKTVENRGNAAMAKPVENLEKPVARKNTFLSRKYKNTDLIQQFKHLVDGKPEKGVAKDAEDEDEMKPWEVANAFPIIKLRKTIKKDTDRQFFEALSKRTIKFARGFREPNRSVLKKVQWQPHFDNHTYKYLITPQTNCYDSNGDYADVTLVVFILTSPVHYSNRRVIRRTWMSHAQREHLDMKMIFLLGATDDAFVQRYIEDEANEHRDILQEDFHDSYVNLTLKTIMGLKWSTQSCPKAKFVMKVDDDVAVNVVNLTAYLKTLNASEDFIGGIVTKGAAPYRNANKKWYVPEDVYPDPTYPPYPQGKSYIMTMNVAREIFTASKQLEIFPWEDVFIGLCLQKIGMQPSEVPGFDGADPIFSAKREVWQSDESLKILQGLLIVFDLRDSQIETIWHAWRFKTWLHVS